MLLFLLDNVFSIELTGFKARRVVAFRKNLIEMAELEIKHAKVSLETLVILNCYLLPLDIQYNDEAHLIFAQL